MNKGHIDQKDTAIKSFFLGPQAENQDWVKREINRIFEHWFDWRTSLFPDDGSPISKQDKETRWFKEARARFSLTLDKLMELYEKETPKFTPRYIGHMVSEISLPALFGHIANLLHNPNLASQEVSKIGSVLEKEAILALSQMIGFRTEGVGHFTSGGTIANFEALWRARYRLDHWLSLGTFLRLNNESDFSLFQAAHMGWSSYENYFNKFDHEEDLYRQFSFVANSPWLANRSFEKAYQIEFEGPVILVPGNKHYSWQKGLSLLGLGDSSFWSIALDCEGRLCCDDLVKKIEKAKKEDRPILMVVSVAGTTELGEIDPVDRVQDILDNYRDSENIHIWHHVDAAYGGFYCSLLGDSDKEKTLSDDSITALKSLCRVDSVTIDPHKLGYVPYACGAIILKDELCNRVSSFAAPYLVEMPSKKAWSTTLEGSRSGSGAAATWMTYNAIGFTPNGLGSILHKGIVARDRLRELLNKVKDCYVVDPCDTNVLCFCLAKTGELTSQTNDRTLAIYAKLKAGDRFAVSKTHLSLSDYNELIMHFSSQWNAVIDSKDLCLIRVVLMNPFIVSNQTNIDFLEAFVSEIKSG